MLLMVIERIPVVGSLTRIEHQPLGFPTRDELDPLPLSLAARARVDRVGIADLDGHPAVAQTRNSERRPPPAIGKAVSFDVVQPIVDQRRPVQPLPEQPFEVLARDLFGDGTKRVLVHVLEPPARVVRAEDLAHRVVTHDVAQLLVEQLALVVDHRVVRGEVAVALADHRDRLAPPVDIPQQDVPFDGRVFRLSTMILEEPAGLEAREPFVEVALTPFVVGQDPHRVVVAELVNDEPETGAAVHDHHGKLGAAAFDPMHVGDLRPGEFAIE